MDKKHLKRKAASFALAITQLCAVAVPLGVSATQEVCASNLAINTVRTFLAGYITSKALDNLVEQCSPSATKLMAAGLDYLKKAGKITQSVLEGAAKIAAQEDLDNAAIRKATGYVMASDCP